MSKVANPPTLPPQPASAATPERSLSLEEIVQLMVDDKLVPADAARDFLTTRRSIKTVTHPLVIISEQKWRDPRQPRKLLHLEGLCEWFAQKCGLGYLHIDPFKIDFAAVTKVMSNAYATRFRILPVQVTKNEVVIATAEPYIREWEAELTQVLRLDIRRVFANPQDINSYLVEFYNLARSIKGAAAQNNGMSDITNFEQLVQLGQSGKVDANDRHIVHIVDWLWQYAFEQGASDIHLEPRRDTGNVRFRIDGVLHQVYQIPTAVMAAMTSRIKILSRMDVVEKRRPQDGRIKTITPDGEEIELRLSTMPTAFGEKLVMRIFNPDVLVRDFSELGFSDEDQTRWNSLTTHPHGIILVTGPTGSGKTTTLYSTLKQLAAPEVNVCTVEDPIEMVEPLFNQMQVHSAIGLDFASGVRTLLRQDPDIIMVGEIRDRETADMAIQASLTGHLVLSTLHTNDAPSAITRLLDIGIEPYLLTSTILGVMAQRLVRTLCPHCREAVPLEDEPWAQVTLPWKTAKPDTAYVARGCLECRMTGYSGRMGLYEMLLMTPQMRKLVEHNADLQSLREQAYRDGMKPLRVSGAIKIAAGQTSVDEVLKVAPSSSAERAMPTKKTA